MDEDDIEQYKNDLKDLKSNQKPLINMLSQVAEDYKDTDGAETISKLISARIAEVKPDQKLYLLYLTDSISKNVRGNYIQIFEKAIVANFEDAFKANINPDIRKKLYFLRKSWQGLFKDAILKRLDRRIRMVDPGWQITGPTQQESVPEIISKPVPGPAPKSALKPTVRKVATPEPPAPKPAPKAVSKQKVVQAQAQAAPIARKAQPVGNVHVNPAFLNKKTADLKAEKLELQVKLDICGDEIQEAREKKAKLERQLAKKETAAEKKAIRFKLLEVNKKMINLDDQKIELENDLKKLEALGKVSYQKPDSTKQASQNSQKSSSQSASSQESTASASPPSKPVKKIIKNLVKPKTTENPLIDILGAPKRRAPTESQKKNLSVASELKNSLSKKKKSTPPQGPPSKIVKSESSLKNNGAPLIPKGRIPLKKKTEPKVEKDDAPDIMDTSVVEPAPPKPAKVSTSSKGSVNVRRPGGMSTNPTELLKNCSIPQVREMAYNKLKTGMLNRRDFDVLINRLSVLEKYEAEKKAAKEGKEVPPPRDVPRDEDSRTRQPWYSHGTPQDREIYHEHPQRQQDWRDTLWDQYHHVHGDPEPRGSAHRPPPHDPWKYDPRNERPPADRKMMPDPRRGDPRGHPGEMDHRRSVSPNAQNNVPSSRNYIVTDDLPQPPRPPIEERPAPVNPAPESSSGGLDLPIDLDTIKDLLKSVESKNATSTSQEKPVKADLDELPKKYIVLPDKEKPKSRRTPTPTLEDEPVPIANLEDVGDDMDDSKLPRVEFTENAIKNRINPLIKRLYAGLQCSACGMRFKKSQTTRYADHLDWHFRVNKQVKNGQIDTHRKWYYKAWDWIMYEEIEDADKKADPSAEDNGSSPKGQDEKKEEAEVEVKVKTLPVTAGDSSCAVCGERFQTAYDDDEDEWHYQDVTKHEDSGKLVHTGCLEDAGNMHIPRMVRSDSIDSIELDKTMEEEDNIDEDTAQDIGIEMDKMNVSPSREKPEIKEENAEPNDVEMKEEEPQADLPQSPKAEPGSPAPQEPMKTEVAEPDPLEETNLYGDLEDAELEEINMSFDAPISPPAV